MGSRKLRYLVVPRTAWPVDSGVSEPLEKIRSRFIAQIMNEESKKKEFLDIILKDCYCREPMDGEDDASNG